MQLQIGSNKKFIPTLFSAKLFIYKALLGNGCSVCDNLKLEYSGDYFINCVNFKKHQRTGVKPIDVYYTSLTQNVT